MHGNDLKKNLDLEKLLSMSDSTSDLELRYRRAETIKGLEARITVVNVSLYFTLRVHYDLFFVQKQLRQLKNRKSLLVKALEKKSYDQPSRPSPRNSSPPFYEPENTVAVKQKKIDEQLEKLKREMGMK